MSDSPADVLEQAIALYRAPVRLSQLRERPLGNTLLLLRIAANDRAAIATAAQATGETTETVTDAALLYIQQVLFADTADAYRLLGARPEDATAQIQEHYRWLMRWLHPDRQPERWEVVYSDRVNQAWQILRSSERRAAYDLSLHSNAPVVIGERQLPMRHRAASQTGGRSLLSARARRHLPQLILGGLSLGAFIALGLLYSSREEMPASTQVATDISAAPPAKAATSESETLTAALPMTTARPRATEPLVAPATSAAAMPDHVSMITISERKDASRSKLALATPTVLPVRQNAAQPPQAIRSQREDVAAFATPTLNAKRRNSLAASGTAASVARVPEEMKNSHAATTDGYGDAATSIAPVAVSQPPKPVMQNTSRSPQEAASAFVGSFTHAYAAGDLAAMMSLFSADAVNNRGGVDAIATDYDNLFRDTQSRELHLERLAWTTSEGRIVGSGPFEASIQRRGESTAQRVDGWITIDARLIDGHWRIQRLIHRNMR